MSAQSVPEIKQAVSRLTAEELALFRQWFDAFDARVWDRQFEADAGSGRLGKVAEDAVADYHSGKCTEL